VAEEACQKLVAEEVLIAGCACISLWLEGQSHLIYDNTGSYPLSFMQYLVLYVNSV